MSAEAVATTVDAFLGGRLVAVQHLVGHHRAGLDAVLLAAAIGHEFSGTVADLGAGTGVAGLAVAARCKKAWVTLVEREPMAVAAAERALSLPQNGSFANRVRIVSADLTDGAAREAALGRETIDAVIMNPPFNDPSAGTTPPDVARAAAHVLSSGLDAWLRAASSLLVAGGRLAVIFRADRLEDLLVACRGRFGSLIVLPVCPSPASPATRVLIAGRKGSRGPLQLLPTLVLHRPPDNRYRPEAEAILREGASLADVHPGWRAADAASGGSVPKTPQNEDVAPWRSR